MGDAQIDIGKSTDVAGLEPLEVDRLPQRPQSVGVDLDWSCWGAGVIATLDDEQRRLHSRDVGDR